jgi:hypothetical protein
MRLGHLAKGEGMPPILGYSEAVVAARQALETAQNALSRDVGQAITQAEWPFLRDRHDVAALVDYITEAAENPDFVSKLHAAADTARLAQPQRGRPPKAANGGTHSHETVGVNAIAPVTI